MADFRLRATALPESPECWNLQAHVTINDQKFYSFKDFFFFETGFNLAQGGFKFPTNQMTLNSKLPASMPQVLGSQSGLSQTAKRHFC